MIVLYQNRNENDELYYAELLTDPHLIEEGISYISVGTNHRLNSPHISDWKKLYINSVNLKDVVCLYRDMDSLKWHQAAYFI